MLGNPSPNVCLPPGAEGVFNIYTTVDPSAQDGDVIAAAATIAENDTSIEEKTMENNDDVTTTTIYRAELLVKKEGRSNTSGTLTATGDDSITAPGEIITYKVEYTNIGNTNAENSIITEAIPEGTCLDVASLLATLPNGASVSYLDESGNTLA